MVGWLGGSLECPVVDMSIDENEPPHQQRCPGNDNVNPPPDDPSPSTAANNVELTSVPNSYICGTSNCRRTVRNGVWCYSCEQWFHFKCQGMKSMNSPEAEKWKITDEEYRGGCHAPARPYAPVSKPGLLDEGRVPRGVQGRAGA